LTHRDQYAAAMLARTDGILQGANPDESSVDPVWRRDTGRVPGVY
jgi:hypothetical protein